MKFGGRTREGSKYIELNICKKDVLKGYADIFIKCSVLEEMHELPALWSEQVYSIGR